MGPIGIGWDLMGPNWTRRVLMGWGGTQSVRSCPPWFRFDPLARPAGSNMLMVGVHGPKTPCEEVYVKHVGNRLYNVTYTVKEKGEYVLILRWGDDSVPGSPFRVTVP